MKALSSTSFEQSKGFLTALYKQFVFLIFYANPPWFPIGSGSHAYVAENSERCIGMPKAVSITLIHRASVPILNRLTLINGHQRHLPVLAGRHQLRRGDTPSATSGTRPALTATTAILVRKERKTCKNKNELANGMKSSVTV